MMKNLIIVALTAALLITPRVAEADSPDDAMMMVIMIPLTQGLVLVGSAVTGIGTGVSMGKSEKPSKGWIVSSYVFGGLNLAAGVTNLALYHDFEFGQAFGATQLGAATLNIVLSSVALYMRGKSVEAAPPAPAGIEVAGMNLSVAPLVAQDAGGGAAVGMGVQLAGW